MYYPTHKEITDLPSVKRNIAEFKKLGLDVELRGTTGMRAYNNGTRKIMMPTWVWRASSKFMYEAYTIYPDRGSVSDDRGYQIKKVEPLKTLDDWDNLLEALFRQKFSPDVLKAMRSTSADELEVLSDSKIIGVKGQVAQNENTSPDTLRKLWRRSRAEEVLNGLLKNPNCPADILANMFKNRESIALRYHFHESWLLNKLYKNPNCPIELVLDADWSEYPEARDTAYSQASKLENEEDRNRILGLITMYDMGIPVSNELINLKDLDI